MFHDLRADKNRLGGSLLRAFSKQVNALFFNRIPMHGHHPGMKQEHLSIGLPFDNRLEDPLRVIYGVHHDAQASSGIYLA